MKSTQPKKMIQRLCFQLVVPMMAGGFSLAAHAEVLEPDYSVTYNVGVLSDYRVRGIAQTSFKPALQGGIDFAHKNGLYLGTAISNVRWVKEFNGATKGSYELDLYGGHKGEISPGLTYDVGVISYRYPGNDSGVGSDAIPEGTYTNASTTEIYGALTYKIYTFKYNRSLGDFLGNPGSSGSQYFDLSAAYDLGKGFSLTPHIGRQLIPNQPVPLSYTDIALTLSKDFGNGFVATAAALVNNADKPAYTDINGRVLSRSVLTLGVKYSF